MSYFPRSTPLNGIYTTSVIASTGGTITLNAGLDTIGWTKIGNLVSIQGQLSISAISSPTGDFRVLLPFNTGTLDNFSNTHVPTWYNPAAWTQNGGVTTGFHPMVVGGNDNYMELQIVGDNSIANRCNVGAGFVLSFTYYTEDTTLNP